jgi:spectinomycin phosphotransferase/16S rRNA (guanine(1405)-N(7))-methyltransferase
MLEGGWGMRVAAMTYRPVGWGSHHWEIADRGGNRWFVTVDELETKRVSASESLDDGFARLRASLLSAVELADAGREFVVAPVPALGIDGDPVARLGSRFAVAVYPFVDGRSFAWGDGDTSDWRLAMVAMVAGVHTAPTRARRRALADDFTVPFLDELEAACGGEVTDSGPCGRPVAALMREHAGPIQRVLERYDRLTRLARSRPGRNVLTHGEPHPGNTMLTAAGWRLIDWDTVLVAPPERDLWTLDPGDGSILDAYAAATGTTPRPDLLDLYRLGWDIKDIAYDVSRFRRPHTGSLDDDKSWRLLCALVRRVSESSAAP